MYNRKLREIFTQFETPYTPGTVLEKYGIYGKEIEVLLLSFRRPERKFAGLEQLQEQLRMDIEAGKEYAGRKEQKK